MPTACRLSQTLGVAREGHCNAAIGEGQRSAFNSFWSLPAWAVRPTAAGARWSWREAFFNTSAMSSWLASVACVCRQSLPRQCSVNRRAFAARCQSAKSRLACGQSESRHCCSRSARAVRPSAASARWVQLAASSMQEQNALVFCTRRLMHSTEATPNRSVKPTCLRHAAYLQR